MYRVRISGVGAVPLVWLLLGALLLPSIAASSATSRSTIVVTPRCASVAARHAIVRVTVTGLRPREVIYIGAVPIHPPHRTLPADFGHHTANRQGVAHAAFIAPITQYPSTWVVQAKRSGLPATGVVASTRYRLVAPNHTCP